MKKILALLVFALTLLVPSAVATDYEPVVYPAQQTAVGNAALAVNSGTYTFSNNLFSASFVTTDGKLKFGGCDAMSLKAGTELFTVTFGDGTSVKASELSAPTVTSGDLTGSNTAVKGSDHFNGKYLQAVYSYTKGEATLTLTWRAELRDGSHYLRTDLTVRSNKDIAMKSFVPMQYIYDTTTGGTAPEKLGNITYGNLLMNDKIFAGLETPMGQNSVGDSDGETYTAFPNVSGWTKDLMTWTPSSIPSALQSQGGVAYTAANYLGTQGLVTFSTTGSVTATFQYQSGACGLWVAGVELVNPETGTVESSNYNLQFTGGGKQQISYTLNNVVAGTVYLMRFYYDSKKEGAANRNTSNGNITWTSAPTAYTPSGTGSSDKYIKGLWSRNTTLRAYALDSNGQEGKDMEWNVSTVVGLVNPAHKRRSYLAYHERERAVPWRPFPLYNSWYELNINRKDHDNPADNMTTAQAVGVVNQWKNHMYTPFGEGIQAYVWDDGWDEYGPWTPHSNFTDGFEQTDAIAKTMNTGIGCWLGPRGGYGHSADLRRKYWTDRGSSHQLSQPDFFSAFMSACREKVQNYDFRFFKFDGISTLGTAYGPANEEDCEGIITVERLARKMREDLFFNTTVGTWASPFWFHFADAIWRQDADHSTRGNGANNREQWITYRDDMVHTIFTSPNPICPINSIMTHGFILSQYGGSSDRTYSSILNELRCAFASGDAMVELYADADLLNSINGGTLWGEIAKCIKWQKDNADVLPDIHWVGGDPWDGSTHNIYGWASWNGTKATFTLRNGDSNSKTITLKLRDALDIPASFSGNVYLVGAFSDLKGSLKHIAAINGTPVEDNTAIDVDANITFTLPGSSVFVYDGGVSAFQNEPVLDDVETEITYNALTGTSSTWSNWYGEVPTRISTLNENYTATNLRVMEKVYEFTEDNNTLTSTFTYTGGSNRLDIVGVEVLGAGDVVIASDYHHGHAGNPSVDNTYTLKNIPAGTYTVRYISTAHYGSESNTNTQGKITNTLTSVEPLTFVSSIQDGATYAFVNIQPTTPRKTYYLYSDGTTLKATSADACSADTEWAASAQFVAVKQADNKFAFKNVANNKYLAYKRFDDAINAATNVWTVTAGTRFNSENIPTYWMYVNQRNADETGSYGSLILSNAGAFDGWGNTENTTNGGYSNNYGLVLVAEPEEPEFNYETNSTITATQLAGLTITFTGDNAANVKLSATQHVAYLTKKAAPAQVKAQNGKFKAAPTGAIEGNITATGETGKFSIAFPEADIVAGDYEVSIPAGTFYVGTTDNPVAELKANYTVEESAPALPPYADLPLTSGVYEIQNSPTMSGGNRGYLVDYTSYTSGPSLAECKLSGYGSKHPADRNDGTTTSSKWYIHNDNGTYYIVSLSTLGSNTEPQFLKPGTTDSGKSTYSATKEPLTITQHSTNTVTGTDNNTYHSYLIANTATSNVYLSAACGTNSTSGAVTGATNANDGGSPWVFIPCDASTLTEGQKALRDRAIEIINEVPTTYTKGDLITAQSQLKEGDLILLPYYYKGNTGILKYTGDQSSNLLDRRNYGPDQTAAEPYTAEYVWEVTNVNTETAPATFQLRSLANEDAYLPTGEKRQNTTTGASTANLYMRPVGGTCGENHFALSFTNYINGENWNTYHLNSATEVIGFFGYSETVNATNSQIDFEIHRAISSEEPVTPDPVTATYTLTPAAGTVKASDLATITLAFTGDFEDVTWLAEDEMEEYVPILYKNDEEWAGPESMTMNDDGTVSISFDTSDITDGEWTLTIPEGTFTTLDANAQAAPVAEITATYTVASTPLTFDPDKKYTIHEPDDSRGYMAYNPATTTYVGLADVTLGNYATSCNHASTSNPNTGIAFQIIESPVGTVKFYCEKNSSYVKLSGTTNGSTAQWTTTASEAATFTFTKEGDNYLFQPTGVSNLYLNPACGWQATQGAVRLGTKESTSDWDVQEYEEPEGPDPSQEMLETAGTYYVYIQDGGKYLMNDKANENWTHLEANKEERGNAYVWRVVSDGTTITLTNGQGNGYKADASATEVTSMAIADIPATWAFTAIPESKIWNVEVRYAENGCIYYGTTPAYNGGFFVTTSGVESMQDNHIFGGPDGDLLVGHIVEDPGTNKEGHLLLRYYTAEEAEDYPYLIEQVEDAFAKMLEGAPGYPDYYEAIEEMFDMEEFAYKERYQSLMLLGADWPEYYKEISESFNNMATDFTDVVMPEDGDAFRLSVRSSDGRTHWYLKEDGSLTTDKDEAGIFVKGSTGKSSDYTSLFVTNNNTASKYLRAQGAMSAQYADGSCDFDLGLMVQQSHERITTDAGHRFGTFSLTANGRASGYTNMKGALIVNESNGTWGISDTPFMDGDVSSAIEMEKVDYPYTKPNFTCGSAGDGHEGGYATIWLPFPMHFASENIQVYKGTVENEDRSLLLVEQVNGTQECVAAGGYILYDPSLKENTPSLVLPAAAAPTDMHDTGDAVFKGSTEDPENADNGTMWSAFVNDNNLGTGDDQYTAYVLGKKTQGIGLYRYTGTTFPKGKAIWLKPNATASSECVKFGFDDIISAIDALNGNAMGSEIYDLQGHRLDKAVKGQVNVINGKKIMFK